MNKLKLTALAAALISSGYVHAATTVGNVASTQAVVNMGAQNVTDAVWVQDSGLSGAESLVASQKLGTLSITATGSHDGLFITADDSVYNGGVTNIPFKNASGEVYFRGKIINPQKTSALIYNKASVDVSGHTGPGWELQGNAETLEIDFGSISKTNKIPAGVYTGTFYIQQYVN